MLDFGLPAARRWRWWIWSIPVWYKAGICAGEPTSSRFQDFQRSQVNTLLPQLPLQIEVYGSIFQTAYYFVDLNIGAPQPQSVSMIIDTGSSTQGIPCQDCEACGHSHWDQYYNRSISEYNEKMPCGACTTCRLNTDEDTLGALVPPLMPLANDPDRFSVETSKLLLNNPNHMQCLYHVHYAEGSSLSGLFYTDVVWLNVFPHQGGAGEVIPGAQWPTEAICPAFPVSPGPSLPLLIPLGCHLEETHLFYDQKASGILGLEFWGTKGVPTFPSAVLDDLQALYQDSNMSMMACTGDTEKAFPTYKGGVGNKDPYPADRFHYSFSLCLSPKGGVMSFGAPNVKFHANQRVIHIGSDEAKRQESPLITSSMKAQSFLLGLKRIRATNPRILVPPVNTPDFFDLQENDSNWKEIELRHPAELTDNLGSGALTKIVPTLLDSGTTLSYLPSRLFADVLFNIENRVALNSELRDLKRGFRRHLRKVTPEQLFSDEHTPLVVKNELDDRRVATTALEYVPVSDRLVPGPKRLVRLASVVTSSRFRRLRNDLTKVYQDKLAPSTKERRLSDALPGWYAVLEPTANPEETAIDSLLGFLDIPESLEGATPRALVSKLDGYNNGECWWLQEKDHDLPLFPVLEFVFYPNVTTLWHPLSYLYSGTNDHFWCLAMMTDGSSHADDNAKDEEIIFGSNSFVHHDVIFNINQSAKRDNKVSARLSPTGTSATSSLQQFTLHPNATIIMTPANCPEREIEGRTRRRRR